MRTLEGFDSESIANFWINNDAKEEPDCNFDRFLYHEGAARKIYQGSIFTLINETRTTADMLGRLSGLRLCLSLYGSGSDYCEEIRRDFGEYQPSKIDRKAGTIARRLKKLLHFDGVLNLREIAISSVLKGFNNAVLLFGFIVDADIEWPGIFEVKKMALNHIKKQSQRPKHGSQKA